MKLTRLAMRIHQEGLVILDVPPLLVWSNHMSACIVVYHKEKASLRAFPQQLHYPPRILLPWCCKCAEFPC